MKIIRKRFALFVCVFLIGYIGPMLAFVIARPPLDADGWAFLEKQRPRMSAMPSDTRADFFIGADGLNFALARRPIGGWEPASVQLYQLLNLPANLAAHATFHALQFRSSGTSRLHSDVATAVFVIVGAVQWFTLALALSVRRSIKQLAA